MIQESITNYTTQEVKHNSSHDEDEWNKAEKIIYICMYIFLKFIKVQRTRLLKKIKIYFTFI